MYYLHLIYYSRVYMSSHVLHFNENQLSNVKGYLNQNNKSILEINVQDSINIHLLKITSWIIVCNLFTLASIIDL